MSLIPRPIRYHGMCAIGSKKGDGSEKCLGRHVYAHALHTSFDDLCRSSMHEVREALVHIHLARHRPHPHKHLLMFVLQPLELHLFGHVCRHVCERVFGHLCVLQLLELCLHAIEP